MIAQANNENKREKAPKKKEYKRPGDEGYCKTREGGHYGQGTGQGRQLKKKEFEKPGDVRGPDDHGRAPHYPQEALLRYIYCAAIRVCEEEDAAGKGPGKGGSCQKEGTG